MAETLFHSLLEAFSRYLWLEGGLSENTRAAYSTDLKKFYDWLSQSDKQVVAVTRADIQQYLQFCYQQGAHARSTARLLSVLRRFYQWLLAEEHITIDPTLNIDGPKLSRPLPKLMSEADVEALLAAPDITTHLGVRDRTILEVLYATGLRISELVGLHVNNVNVSQGVVRVIGKGNKERLVPMGEHALTWVQCYCDDARIALLKSKASDFLFISQQARPTTRQTVWHRLKKYALICDLDTTLSPHTLRHAFATHLLNHDVDLRVVQLLLGHSDVSTTTIYTHIAKARLQALHKEHHPRG